MIFDMNVILVNLSNEEIPSYEQVIGQGTFRWCGFTSTSRSRQVAEFYDANVLMIIQLTKHYPNDGHAIDMKILSQFPKEDELLLRANVQFRVEKLEYDQEKNKHLIYIEALV